LRETALGGIESPYSNSEFALASHAIFAYDAFGKLVESQK
jgi:hypothetical protein